MSNNAENLPYGPLTFDDWNELASSFYDESRKEVKERAFARGIRKHELPGVYIKFVRAGIDPIADPYHRIKESSVMLTWGEAAEDE